MNIYTQVCGLIIIGLLIFFYSRQNTLEMESEHRFVILLYVSLGCILTDIASAYLCSNYSYGDEARLFFMAKLYLILHVLSTFCAMQYVYSDICANSEIKKNKYLFRFSWLIFAAMAGIIIYLSPQIATIDEKICVTGTITRADEFFNLLLIIAILALVFIYRPYIKAKRIRTIIIWMAIWLMAGLIQYFFTDIYTVSFASALGALVVFFEMVNPEATISRRTGHFSSSSIRYFLDYKYKRKDSFSVLMISFRTKGESASDSVLLQQTINQLSDFLFSIKYAKTFDTAGGYFLLIFDNENLMQKAKSQLEDFFLRMEEKSDINTAFTLLHPFYIMVPKSNIATSGEELMTVLTGFIPTDHKTAAKSQVTVTHETIAEERHKKHVEDMVVEALLDDRIEVFYQPIFSVAQKSFSSAEALVRIRLKNGNHVLPETFIPIAEETGHIMSLSDAIYKKTMSFIKLFHIERLGIEKIQLNLSIRQAETATFATHIASLLNSFDLSANMLNLEITNTNIIHNQDLLLNNMHKLKAGGLDFALDDFGSGSSNLNYLLEMPISIIKLDRKLTHAYLDNERATSILKGIVDISHAMNIKLVAEGIESEEAMKHMVELGIDYIQGFYYSRPLSEREFLAFIQEKNC